MIRTAFLEVTAPWCDNYGKEKGLNTKYKIVYIVYTHDLS